MRHVAPLGDRLSHDRIRRAYCNACQILDADAGLTASTKLEMCRALNVEPWQLEEALTDEMIDFVLFG